MAKAYPRKIHNEAISRHFKGKQTAAEITKVLGIPHQTIGAWITDAKSGKQDTQWTPRKIRDIQNKVVRLENIIAVLKSVSCTPSSPLGVKLAEMERLYGEYPARILCDALDVSLGTFLNHMKRNKKSNNTYNTRRKMLKDRISAIYDSSRQIYGVGKIAAKIREEGTTVSKEMVHELMLELGLFSIRMKSKELYKRLCKESRNQVKGNFNPAAPNKIWTSDVTEFHYKISQSTSVRSWISLRAR